MGSISEMWVIESVGYQASLAKNVRIARARTTHATGSAVVKVAPRCDHRVVWARWALSAARSHPGAWYPENGIDAPEAGETLAVKLPSFTICQRES